MLLYLDQSSLRYVFQEQITELILENVDTCEMIESLRNYTVNVYAHILNFFPRLKHFTIIETFDMSYPCLALFNLSSTTFSSSTLTHLYVDVEYFDDCLCLLDGRLKQLNTLVIRLSCIYHRPLINHNMVGFNE